MYGLLASKEAVQLCEKYSSTGSHTYSLLILSYVLVTPWPLESRLTLIYVPWQTFADCWKWDSKLLCKCLITPSRHRTVLQEISDVLQNILILWRIHKYLSCCKKKKSRCGLYYLKSLERCTDMWSISKRHFVYTDVFDVHLILFLLLLLLLLLLLPLLNL